jgi:hypothetical protein
MGKEGDDPCDGSNIITIPAFIDSLVLTIGDIWGTGDIDMSEGSFMIMNVGPANCVL